jgi:hypothetical protein
VELLFRLALIIIQEKNMNYMVNWKDRPVVTLTEATMITGLSPSTLKRRIASGQISAIDRQNIKERILIYTKSIAKYLQEAE